MLRQIQASTRDSGFSLTVHVLQQITVQLIPVDDICNALLTANVAIIEDYPDDPRGPSCLVYGDVSAVVLHVHVSHPPEIVVITAYKPDPQKWQADLKTRR